MRQETAISSLPSPMTMVARARDFLAWRRRVLRHYRRLLCFAVAFAVMLGMLVAVAGTDVAIAQEPERWSTPLELSRGIFDSSGQPLSSLFPSLVADTQGNVHALWTLSPGKDDASQVGAIFYSRWDGVVWSAPVDVLATAGRAMWLPQAAIDTEDRIHLVWMHGAGGALWYSSAAAGQASSAQGWSEPRRLSALSVTGAAVACGHNGRVYVAFCSGKEDDRAYLMQSEDGVRWSSAKVIGEGCDDCMARLAVDAGGGVHAVFGSQFTGGKAVYYARSLDGGATWSPPLELDHVDDRYAQNYGPNLASVLANGDQVHIIWDGAPAGQRWHQWSADRGETWTAPQQVSRDQRGLTLPVAMAVDSAGTVHLLSMGWRDSESGVSGAFHFYWKGGVWSAPQLIGERTDWNAEYPALTVVGGNLLVAAWTERANDTHPDRIWASTLQVDAPKLFPAPTATLPVPAPTATATVEAVKTSPPVTLRTAQPSPSATAGVPSAGLGTPAKSDWSGVVVAMLCSSAVVVAGVVFHLLRRRRG